MKISSRPQTRPTPSSFSPSPKSPQPPEPQYRDTFAAVGGGLLGLASSAAATSLMARATGSSGLLTTAGMVAGVAMGAYAGQSAVHTPAWGEDLLQGTVSRRLRQGLVKAAQADDNLVALAHGARVGAESGAIFGAVAGAVAGATSLAGLATGFFGGALAGALAGASAGGVAGLFASDLIEAPTPPATVDNLDLARYGGDWYEIARFPNVFQKEDEAGKASYRLAGDRVEVVNTGFDPATGEYRAVEGFAFQPDPEEGGKLKVSFAPGLKEKGWLAEDYWVLDVDQDYNWALVGDPTRSFLWILSRQPQMDVNTEQSLRQRLESQGWDLTALRPSPPYREP